MWEKIKSVFGSKDATKPSVKKPMALGLGVGMPFKVDKIVISSILSELAVDAISAEHVIQSAGTVDMDGVTLIRLYTDEDAWLQIVFDGEPDASNVIDITLFQYYDTLSIDSDVDWEHTFRHKISKPTYTLEKEGKQLVFTPVWEGTNGVSAPVRLEEVCYDHSDEPGRTLQCAMLYERPLRGGDDGVEVLFVAAEQRLDEDSTDRCLVLSTGIKLARHQIEV